MKPKRPLLFVLGFFAVAFFLFWLFPEVSEKRAVCQDCGAVHQYIEEEGVFGFGRRHKENTSQPKFPVPADHYHHFGDPSSEHPRNVPRWKL